MELEYSRDIELAGEVLKQMRKAILLLQEWNKDVVDMHDLEKTVPGMQRLAGNCMLIQTIGEGVKKVDKYSDSKSRYSAYRKRGR